MNYILAALIWLAPHLGEVKATRYAAVVAREANQHLIDPLLILAYVQGESQWQPRLRSRTHDHGLGQIHVSETTNHELMGHQDALLSPEYNLAVTASMMRMWRDYHAKHCRCSRCHHWLAHMKWGRMIRGQGGVRALTLYGKLRRMFAPKKVLASSGW